MCYGESQIVWNKIKKSKFIRWFIYVPYVPGALVLYSFYKIFGIYRPICYSIKKCNFTHNGNVSLLNQLNWTLKPFLRPN